jgi:WD40 repeat protein
MADQDSDSFDPRPEVDATRVETVPGVRLLHVLPGKGIRIGRIAWSPGGQLIAAPSCDGTISIWNVERDELVRVLRGHSDVANAAAWSADGRLLATASSDRTILVWEVEKDTPPVRLEGHASRVFCVVWSPDSTALVSGSEDCHTFIWDVSAGFAKNQLPSDGYWVNTVAWSPGGQVLAIGGGDGTIQLIDRESTNVFKTLRGHGSYVVCVVWSPDGTMIASSSYDGTIRLWNAQLGTGTRILEGHTQPVNCISFSSDGQLLASKSCDGSVRIWRCDTWDTAAVINEPTGRGGEGSAFDHEDLVRDWLPGISFHPERPLLATLGEADTVVRVWGLDTEILLGKDRSVRVSRSVHHTTAKIVLVGESGVGKTGLGWPLCANVRETVPPPGNQSAEALVVVVGDDGVEGLLLASGSCLLSSCSWGRSSWICRTSGLTSAGGEKTAVMLSGTKVGIGELAAVLYGIEQRVVLDGVVDGGGGEEGVEPAPAGGGVVLGEDGIDDGALGERLARL